MISLFEKNCRGARRWRFFLISIRFNWVWALISRSSFLNILFILHCRVLVLRNKLRRRLSLTFLIIFVRFNWIWAKIMRTPLFNIVFDLFLLKCLFQIYSIDELDLKKYFKEFFVHFIIDLLSIVNREINAINSVDHWSQFEISELFRIIQLIFVDHSSFCKTDVV